MDYNYINKILKKYFEGNTSLQEEADLKKYFLQEEILPEHRPYKPMFRLFTEEKQTHIPKAVQFKRPERKKNYKLAIAVVFILGVGLFGLLIKGNKKKTSYAHSRSKKEIYNEVKKYSYDLNKGLKQISAFGFLENKSISREKDSADIKNTKN